VTKKSEKVVDLPAWHEATLGEAEVVRFYSEVGREIVELGRMFRSPTEQRPFVYELRLDLWPASSSSGLAVIKGFGTSNSMIAFQEGSGLVAQLRGLHGRLRAGGLRFSDDKFEPDNYQRRLKKYRDEADYLSAKLTNR